MRLARVGAHAIISAIVGPVLAALLLYQFGYWLSNYWPGGVAGGMAGAPAGAAHAAFIYYGLIVAGPGAAILGALGSWLLIRKQDQGSPRTVLYGYGAVLGIVFGLLCAPTSILVWAVPFGIFGTGTLGVSREVLVWADPRNPFVAVAATTGLILGLVIAWLVARRYDTKRDLGA